MQQQTEECIRPEAPEAPRGIRITERAFYLSRHRRLEGKTADPNEDWLSAEWIEDHMQVYGELMEGVTYVMRSIAPAIRFSEINTLPTESWCLDLLREVTYGMSIIRVEEGLVSEAFLGSKTVGGVLLELVFYVRRISEKS